MRISVLTGLFACAVVFVASTVPVEASAQTNAETTPPSNVTIEKIEAVTEISKSPLLKLAEEPAVEESATPDENIEVKHVVGENESLSKIAQTYETTWQRIYDKNTQLDNPDVISVGQELVVPNADEVLEPREIVIPEVVSSATPTPTNARSISQESKTSVAPQNSGSTAGNKYVAGYCTWYVKNRRPDMPNNLGNASTWVSRAAAQGMATGSSPQVGAVGQQGNHVVYIESVNGDGTVTVSDMNWAGLYVITTRTVPASSFTYIY